MAKKKRTTKKVSSESSVKLVVSDQNNPSITIKPGMKIEVVSVSLVEPTMKPAQPIAARLCGGTSTCIALIETSERK